MVLDYLYSNDIQGLVSYKPKQRSVLPSNQAKNFLGLYVALSLVSPFCFSASFEVSVLVCLLTSGRGTRSEVVAEYPNVAMATEDKSALLVVLLA